MMEFTVLFPFCGLGAGARGFLEADVSLLGQGARFRSLGGIDIEREACADFEMLTRSPALCADVATLTPHDLEAFVGSDCPDVIFASPPCKGFSGLISKASASKPKYQQLNRLVVQWLELVLATWTDRPRLILIENVPRISSRGRPLLDEVRALLGSEGYVFDERSHDCGELGGLAQHRRRFLLVARLPSRCPSLLYQPPKKRVRGCGEVLGQLPMPGDPSAGPMHELPRISWLNWVRLALIPAGGDWRDLPGVLEQRQARRDVHKRHEVSSWDHPTGTVTGSRSSGVGAVADPRPAGQWRGDTLGVRSWDEPSGTVTGRAHPSTGAFAVADPRVNGAYDHGYKILRWEDPSFTIAGQTSCGCGAYQVADPRIDQVEGKRIAFDELLSAWEGDPGKPPPFTPLIICPDGCWHRPMTTLELAVLQGLPSELDGAPLELCGSSSSRWRERIGNAVPTPTAEAIATQMLVALTEGELGTMSLSSSAVWVAPEERRAA